MGERLRTRQYVLAWTNNEGATLLAMYECHKTVENFGKISLLVSIRLVCRAYNCGTPKSKALDPHLSGWNVSTEARILTSNPPLRPMSCHSKHEKQAIHGIKIT